MRTDRSLSTCRPTRQPSGPIGCPRRRTRFSRYLFALIGRKRQCWTANGHRLPRSVRKAAPWGVSSRFTKNPSPLLAQSGHRLVHHTLSAFEGGADLGAELSRL